MTTLFAIALLALAYVTDGFAGAFIGACAVLLALMDLGARIGTAGTRSAASRPYRPLDDADVDMTDSAAVLAYMAEAQAALAADLYAYIHERTEFGVHDVED